MKIKEVIEEGKNVLSKNNIEDNVIVTRELLAFVLGVEKQYLVIHLADELNAEDYIKFKENININCDGSAINIIASQSGNSGPIFFELFDIAGKFFNLKARC